jgi:two-component system KDP operon response regulator KdpE
MSEAGPLVLMIEDEAPMRHFLRVSLSSHGYRISEAETGKSGLEQTASRNPDVILLDLGLPDTDGLTVTQQLRGWVKTPIIVISARGQEEDKIKALDAGADDYLTKPFGVGELLARIRVALRHANSIESGSPQFTVGELSVDLSRRLVSVRGNAVHLTPLEYKLLTALIKSAGKVVTHRQLLHEAWGPGYGNQTQYLRVYMGLLRHKLETNPSRPEYLITEPGIGYRLRSELESK